MSSIDKRLSDLLCTVSTGQAQAKRAHYENEDIIILKVRKPLILNGIPDIASQPDLADRSIKIELPKIPEARRKTEQQFWAEFDDQQPRIFGALLDVAASALKCLPAIQTSNLPRMSDFARWIIASEKKLGWPTGTFLKLLKDNRDASKETTLDDCPVVSALARLLVPGSWKGNMTALLESLNKLKVEHEARHPDWPKSPNTLSGILRRVEGSLDHAGFKITFNKRTKLEGRTVTIQSTS